LLAQALTEDPGALLAPIALEVFTCASGSSLGEQPRLTLRREVLRVARAGGCEELRAALVRLAGVALAWAGHVPPPGGSGVR
jgi:hypothetical protein